MLALSVHYPPRARRGVTPLEVLLVAIVVAGVASVTVPRISARAYRADAEARHTQAVLQLAQRLAVTQHHEVIVSFDIPRHRIRIAEDWNAQGAAEPREQVTWHTLEYGLRFTPPPGQPGIGGPASTAAIQGSNLRMIDGMPSLIFLRYGAATSDAQIYLALPRSALEDYRVVSVTRSTGETLTARLPAASGTAERHRVSATG